MFKKLKDKIAEEVKSSPQRIQQLTQSVADKIHTATSDDSFFSIGEDDEPSSNVTPEPGFSNVSLTNYSTPQGARARKSSNSSAASDMSFLPRYESATNLYHLQSDLDVSASEVEDNASSSSQLGHLSKEQIYAAFQKAQVRYHKYRGRYTDIANHYRELERENVKMKSVLVETQDKALRRVAELREQCALEQKAKAHLENALRIEIDEKQYIIDTLKTKVDLLQSKSAEDVLVVVDDVPDKSHDYETITKDLKDAQVEIESLNERLQECKANAIVFASKESGLKGKIRELEEIVKMKSVEIDDVLERERENNLIIAQTKMELHTEIQNRDLEIENLKQDVETVKSELEQYENKAKGSKLDNLQSQNAKLIEKIESLSAKCKGYESELLKLEQVKIESENRVEELDEKHRVEIEKHRDETKQQLLTLEARIAERCRDEFRAKEEGLQADFDEKLRQLAANTSNFEEIQVRLLEKEDELATLLGKLDEATTSLRAQKAKYNELETNHLELIDENSRNAQLQPDLENLQRKHSQLETALNHAQNLQAVLEADKTSLTSEIAQLQSDLSVATRAKEAELERRDNDEIQSLIGEISAFKEQNDTIRGHINEYKEKLSAYETSSAQKSHQLQELARENETIKAEIVSLARQKHEEIAAAQAEIQRLTEENADRVKLVEENAQLINNSDELNAEVSRLQETDAKLRIARNEENENLLRTMLQLEQKELENAKLQNDLAQVISDKDEVDKIIGENKKLKAQLRSFEERCETGDKNNTLLESQMREMEHQYTELVHERQLLQDEIQELKISPINVNNNTGDGNNDDAIIKTAQEEHEKEINHLNEKIIQYKSLDLTNRTSIQFYENELQKLKNKNEKLNRKLDETLVTLNHCTELTTSTETEYLRNVLYNYMLGKEGVVLARVIAAVCKFDDDQTEAILQREQQKQTLLGQLGFR